MQTVTLQAVRKRIALIESLNERGVGTAVTSQQFELACLRELLTFMTQPKMMAVGVMSAEKWQNLENGHSRFIALWPRPTVHVRRPRPTDGILVYARVEGDQ